MDKVSQKGTKRLVEQYGKALICERYRYDEKRGVRLRPVELVVEEKTYRPFMRYRDEDIVTVIVAYTETDLCDTLKKAGGRWDTEERILKD